MTGLAEEDCLLTTSPVTASASVPLTGRLGSTSHCPCLPPQVSMPLFTQVSCLGLPLLCFLNCRNRVLVYLSAYCLHLFPIHFPHSCYDNHSKHRHILAIPHLKIIHWLSSPMQFSLDLQPTCTVAQTNSSGSHVSSGSFSDRYLPFLTDFLLSLLILPCSSRSTSFMKLCDSMSLS